MKLLRTAAVIAGACMLLVGCGGDDLPDRAEFISEMKKELTGEFDSLEGMMDKEDAEKLFDEFLGCTYDAIKDDEELLKKALENATDEDVSSQIEAKATECGDKITEAITEAAGG